MNPTAVNLLDDEVAVSIGNIVAVANRAARELGVDVARSELSLSRDPLDGALWNIHYGPQDYIRRRGGDVTIVVNSQTLTALHVQRGQ